MDKNRLDALRYEFAELGKDVNGAENWLGQALYREKKIAALLAGAVVPPISTPAPEPTPAPQPQPPSEPATLPVGPDDFAVRYALIGNGGGFITGLDIASDGSRMVCVTDVFNGYIREEGDGEWKLLLRTDNLPQAEYDPRPDNKAVIGNNDGCYSARIAPSDPDTIYATWNGFLYRTGDGAKSWERSVLPAKAFLANNGPSRRFTRGIDVHPSDPGKVLVGTNNDGCYYSPDGFREKFIRLDLPATTEDYSGTPGKYLVAWGPNGGAWVHVFGTGLFHAPKGGEGQFLFAGGPKTASNLVIGSDQSVYVCEFRTKQGMPPLGLHAYRDGEWIAIDGSRLADQVAVDPFDPLHLVWTDENSARWWQSFDGGRDAIDLGNEWRGQGESDWLSNREKATYPAQLLFDPVVRNRLWVAEGVGINFIDLPGASGGDLVMHDVNAGIQELIPTAGLSVAGTNYLGVMDKGVWLIRDGVQPQWTYCPSPGRDVSDSEVVHLRALDYAADDPQWMAGIFQQGGSNGFSTDGGGTWTPFAPPPGQKRWKPGGDLAVGASGNLVIVEANNGVAYWTKDGERFHPVMLDGVTPLDEQINAYYVQRHCVAADKSRPGTFALLHNNDFIGRNPDKSWIQNPKAGIWINRNGGEGPWEHTLKGLVDADPGKAHSGQFWQAKLTYIDGRPGELLYAPFAAYSPPADNLVWLKDDGREAVDLPVTRLRGFDLGKPAPGEEYPSLWFWGVFEEREGWYVSFDWLATPPILVSERPMQSIVKPAGAVVADRQVLGRCYLGLAGNGWAEARAV